MCGYLVVVKIVAKIRLSCKCYVDGQRMNMWVKAWSIKHLLYLGLIIYNNIK
jgi:hypothetical protein